MSPHKFNYKKENSDVGFGSGKPRKGMKDLGQGMMVILTFLHLRQGCLHVWDMQVGIKATCRAVSRLRSRQN